MKTIVTMSGGKDSTATALLALKQKDTKDIEFVFCDTGFESPITYDYLKYLEKELDIEIKVLKSKKYESFEDLALKKGRFPSTKARFCTEELKVKPMIDYLLSLEGYLVVWQGIRADESKSRSQMNTYDEYFLSYKTPYKYDKNNKPVYHTYRKKEVLKWLEKNQCYVYRPIFNLNANQVFDLHRDSGIEPNPLYKLGFKRVGCKLCIMCAKSEVKLFHDNFPEQLEQLEQLTNSTFFPPDYIPGIFRDKQVKTKKGLIKYSSIKAVLKYVLQKFRANKDQQKMFPESPNTCKSIYNVCE